MIGKLLILAYEQQQYFSKLSQTFPRSDLDFEWLKKLIRKGSPQKQKVNCCAIIFNSIHFKSEFIHEFKTLNLSL